MVKGLHGRDNLALHGQKGYRLSLVNMVTDMHGQDGYRLAYQGLHWPRCMLKDLHGQDGYRLVIDGYCIGLHGQDNLSLHGQYNLSLHGLDGYRLQTCMVKTAKWL